MVLPKRTEVLLVEDNLDDARLILRALSELYDEFAITAVQDGAEALDCIFATGRYANRSPFTPHLVLLDMGLPKRDGLDVLRILRTYARTKVIPVVVLSASLEERKIADSYELGANSYLVKPQDPAKFRQLVRETGTFWRNVHLPQEADHLGMANGKSEPAPERDDLAHAGT
jgi:two-component system, response regulator